MKGKKNIEDLNWELIAKYLNDETNSNEKLEIKEWLDQSNENQEEMEQSRQMLEKVDVYFKIKNIDSSAAWKNVHSKINPTQLKVIQHKNIRKEAIAKFYKYAAIIIVALLLGSIGYYVGFRNPESTVYSEIISGENQILNEFILPDGSTVTLNNNSKLIFPKKFNNNIREVTIIGEAFFDIKPNPEKPFVINAGNAQIKVLGTSFNVCAYPETETVEVVVETGKVQVINKNIDSKVENYKVLLAPGEKGTLFNANNVLKKSININPNFLAWKTHDLIFNEIPLNEVIKCLEKVYLIKIQVMEPELNDLLLTAHFDKKPIDFVLDVIRLTFNLELSEENELFVLSSRNKEQLKP